MKSSRDIKTVTINGKKWVDLGLPSGRLWAAKNEPGYHQFDEAVKTFGNQLPPIEDWEELFKKCKRTWDKDRKGYLLTGPNGNSLFLPAEGNKSGDEVNRVGSHGYYWSSTIYETTIYNKVISARDVYFSNIYIETQYGNNRHLGVSVRLAREPK